MDISIILDVCLGLTSLGAWRSFSWGVLHLLAEEKDTYSWTKHPSIVFLWYTSQRYPGIYTESDHFRQNSAKKSSYFIPFSLWLGIASISNERM